MKKKEKKSERIADMLDMPLDVLCDMPRTEISGRSRVYVENFRGILDYNESCIKINTTTGIVKIDADNLVIESITDEGVWIKGMVIRIEFI